MARQLYFFKNRKFSLLLLSFLMFHESTGNNTVNNILSLTRCIIVFKAKPKLACTKELDLTPCWYHFVDAAKMLLTKFYYQKAPILKRLTRCTSVLSFKNVSTVVTPNFEFHKHETHEDLRDFSINQPDKFWGSLAQSRLKWLKPFKTVQSCNLSEGKFSWFLDGQLNISGIDNTTV